MPHDVEQVDVYFSTSRKMTLDEAREIEVHLVTKLLQMINQHEQLRPFLREYPFTPERICVRVTGLDQNGKHFSDGSVAFVFLSRGRVFYDTYDVISGLEDFYDEPFVEAVKIVENSSDSKRGLFSHTAPSYETQIESLLDRYSNEMRKKFGLVCVNRGGKLADGIEEVGFSFICSKKLRLESARAIEIEATEKLVEMINADETLRTHLKGYPFSASQTRMQIEFQNYQGDHYPNGNVATVLHENGKLLYETLEPPPKDDDAFNLRFLAEESYEEAKMKVMKPLLKK
ncbi:MAG: hypothetical protein V4492_07680 [Chlamydiota bacterium]